MSNVVKLDVQLRHPPIVSAAEMYAQIDPSDTATWAMCTHIQAIEMRERNCAHCPHQFEDPVHGTLIHGCYLGAQQALKYAMAALKLDGWKEPEKP